MESILIVAFLVMLALKLALKGLGKTEPVESLCASCRNAFVATGPAGQKHNACTYGGSKVEVSFTVTECSGYQNRELAVPARTIGFIDPAVAELEAFPAVVIRVAAARKEA